MVLPSSRELMSKPILEKIIPQWEADNKFNLLTSKYMFVEIRTKWTAVNGQGPWPKELKLIDHLVR